MQQCDRVFLHGFTSFWAQFFAPLYINSSEVAGKSPIVFFKTLIVNSLPPPFSPDFPSGRYPYFLVRFRRSFPCSSVFNLNNRLLMKRKSASGSHTQIILNEIPDRAIPRNYMVRPRATTALVCRHTGRMKAQKR